MNTLLRWLTSPEWALVVKALLHSLWQGALIAGALALLLRRAATPAARYRLALAGLGAVVAATVVTWGVLNAPEQRATQSAPVPEPFAATPIAAGPVKKIVVAANWTPARQQTHWTAWLALAWLLGASAMLGRASVKVAGAEQLRRSCQPLDDPRIANLVAEARRAVRLTREVRVAVTNQLTSPAVVGVVVPTLILPLSLLITLTPEQIRFVLLHELAHIRRGDYLANLFQLFAEALLFFNPAVWWLSHQIRREREACCDALAIELSGAPADYARTLVSVAETMLNPSPAAAPAFGNEREPSSLSDRVQRVLIPGYRPSLRLTWRAMLAALVAGGVLLGLLAAGTRETVAATAALLATDKQAESAVTAEVAPMFQLRLVQDAATPDTETMVASTTKAGSGTMLQETLHVQKKVLLDRSAIKSTSVEISSQPGRPDLPIVNFSLTPEGTKQFTEITRDNIGRRLAIIVEGKVVSAPFIRSEIPGGHGLISGNFTVDEARRLAAVIGGAAIPESVGITGKTSGISISSESATFNSSEKALTARGNVEITAANGMKITTEEARIQMGTNSAAIGANTNLHTRTFKVDLNTFVQGLDSMGGVKSTNLHERIQDFFTRAGADLQSPKAMFFNDRTGALFVRASLADLDIIEQALQVLNTSAPQVNIRAKFVEVPGDGSGNLFLGALGSAFTNSNGGKPANMRGNATGLAGTNNPMVAGLTGILTDPQFRVVLRALEQREGVEILSAPDVTTVSGRQAQLQVVDIRTIVSGLSTVTATNGTSTNVFQTSELPFGPMLDVIPFVSADGFTVNMTLIPTVTEFVGYQKPDPALTKFAKEKSVNAELPLPIYRKRQAATSATVWDGQTIVIGGFASEIVTRQPDGSKTTKPDPKPKKKQLFVFITPTIIDPAGNRVHVDEEVSSRTNAAPKQPGK